MTMDAWIAGAVFLVVYALIAIDRWDRTLLALFGALLVVSLGIIDQEQAFAAIDLNVIFLLVGMMIIASVLAQTGFFEWLAIRSVRLSHGHPIRLLLILSLVTAVVSAFLDNVTTVVLMVPITMSVARRLDMSPVPYLLAQVFASNIGGTATLIGDPPNIMIGSAAGLGFDMFLLHLTPAVVMVFLGFAAIMALVFRNSLKVPNERREAALERTEERAIKDEGLLIRALLVAAGTIVGFLLHGVLGIEAATVALLGATVLMLIAGLKPHELLKEIEWSTIFFFVGLFVLVEGLVATGIVADIADALAQATKGDLTMATLGILWLSASVSAVIDNIPYTATAIPIVHHLIDGGMEGLPLWWALSLGACLGGNLTIVGASANVVVVNLSARDGHPIGFVQFLKLGVLVWLTSMLISTAYLWFVYLT